jgi:hypothetical protein
MGGFPSQRLKQPECEVDHSTPCSAGVKNGEVILQLPTHIHGVVLNYLSTETNSAFPFTFIHTCWKNTTLQVIETTNTDLVFFYNSSK